MLLFLSLTQFGAVTILLVKIAFKTYLSSLSLILTMANSKRTVYMCPTSAESEIVRLVSLRTEISEITRLKIYSSGPHTLTGVKL